MLSESQTQPKAKTASCLCGSVKMTLEGEPLRTNLCHCSSCRKWTGSVFGSMAAFKEEQVKFESESKETIKTHEDKTPESGNVLYRSFCGQCGSPLSITSSAWSGMVALPAGIFDDVGGLFDGDFKPQMEYFCRGRLDWTPGVEGAKKFDAMS